MRSAGELVSRAEYARRRGVAWVVVDRAVKAGRLKLVKGKIDAATADEQWREHTNADQQARGEGNRKPRNDSYYRARTEREGYQAKSAELDYLARVGELVRKVDVEKASYQKARVLRDRILSIPDRMAPILAAETEPNRVHELLRAEILSILRALATGNGHP